MRVDGRSATIEYMNWHETDHLPMGLSSLLAIFRKNLPRSFDETFDYLKVPRLPPVLGTSAQQYRMCEIHDEWMKVEDIPIVYGCRLPTDAYAEAKRELFPNARRDYSGGLTERRDFPRTMRALYCESCRSAEDSWRKRTTKDPNRSERTIDPLGDSTEAQP